MGLLNKFRKNRRSTLNEEVIEHLTDFLNTKRNFGAYPNDYGIDSYIYLDTAQQVILQLIADMKKGLEKYERRVDDIQIEPLTNESSLILGFRISCKIEEVSHSFQLSFLNQKNLYKIEAKK